MGSSHDLQNRRKRRNSDCISNYVDRVRICDTKSIDSESIYSKANSQKSGWRQKSLSNIDLSLSSKDYQPGAGAFRYRDFEAHDDLCIKNIKNSKNIEIQRDYEDVCNINPKAQGQKRDIIHEHNKVHLEAKSENNACSLRRSKSLAVIREETYNELAITGTKTRRSQLIPRAKLIDRNFFRDRLSFPLDEAFSLGLDSNIDNDCKSSNPNYFSWHCDRSDLGSIDSSIFKHSLHQSSLEKSNSLKTDSTKVVSRAEIHNDAVSCKSQNHESIANAINLNEDTASGITIIEIKDRQQYSGPTSSVISYDSIYLSSESDRQTVLGETTESIADIDAKIRDFEEIIKDLNVVGDSEKTESIIDNLYSQVGKGKAEASAVEPKISPETLSKYTDYISKGTLDHLTILTGITTLVDANCDKIAHSKSTGSVTEFQYSSLPDAGISKLLRDCERIDANLRDDVSVELLEPYPDYDSLPNEANERLNDRQNIYEISSGEGEEKFVETKSPIEPISLEDSPKGAPSIELVQLPSRNIIDNNITTDLSKEILERNTTKIYLPDIGVEFDYENSIASFESDSDFESPPLITCKPPVFNLVTISGRKVIVDELAAKVEQTGDKKQIAKDQQQKVQLEVQLPETKSSVAISPSKTVVRNVNNDFKNRAHIDKDEKIKLSECKQQSIDNNDKNKLSHLNSIEIKKLKAAIQSEPDYKSQRLLRRNCLSFNMPRPQLLSIIDSKNSAPKKDSPIAPTTITLANVKAKCDKGQAINQTEKEFLHKVDSVRNYWSKILDEDEDNNNKSSNLKKMSKNFLSSKSSNDIPESLKNEDFQSFIPTVEIVDLNDDTQAALVTSRKLNDVEFDHVRYKVMKSDMFQKNLLVSNRKETQFDGLMQYLQDYSFQELLANNNVVIIEPVRTKIEKISEKPNKAQSATCKITNGALNRNGSNNLKKHFFYHPIRVNKELYEEELPVPDTVRNVRKLFEGSLKRGILATKVEDETKLSSDGTRRKTIRYLTIDTSFDNNNMAAAKWDSISLSSGVSSAADLNSPCECQDSSKDNLDKAAVVCDDDSENNEENNFKSHFVSADVLEKIRECGSSITYYGGQTSSEGKRMSSDQMTKAIMQEISNHQKCNCQPRRIRLRESNERSISKLSNDYSGLKFKLVKSNSCSSRLELTGTGLEKSNFDAAEQMRNIIHHERDDSSLNDDDNIEHYKALSEHEETVKDMVNRLESKTVAAPSMPRIIESRCIEKVKDLSPKVTINQQSFEQAKADPNENVTVNSHISIPSSGLGSANQHDDADANNVSKPKVVRNKNVDLALASVTRRNEHLKNPKASSGDTDNLAHTEVFKEMPELSHIRQSKWSNISKMDSVEMVKNQDKINNCAHIKSHPNNFADNKTSQKPPQPGLVDIKMVNWSTVGSALGKEYIANDRSLTQTKIYDEMEFEEFEVMGEHYDSLNSK